MMTAILIVVALALVVILVGVCCEICGGSFLGWMLLLQGTPGLLFEALAAVFAAILDGLKD